MLLRELQEIADADKVRQDCAEWFNVCPTEKMYHGTEDYTAPVSILKLKAKRKPSGSSIRMHDAVNDFFEEKFGWRAREAGLFCTGHAVTGSIYSNKVYPHIAIPIGKFEYLWSAEIPDMYGIYTGFMGSRAGNFPKYDDTAARRIDSEDATIEKVKNAKWHFNEGIVPALKLDVEIIVKADSFYLIRPESDLAEQLYGKYK